MTDMSMSEQTVKVEIEDAGPSRKKLTITVPAEQVSTQMAISSETFTAEAHLPGFRKGHAPAGLIQRKFGDHILQDVRQQLVSNAYSQVIEEKQLKVLGDPEGLDSIGELAVEENQPITFSVEVDIAPEFDLPTLDEVDILKPIIEVKDDAVDEQITRLLRNEGELAPREQGEAGDFCIGRGIMRTTDGEEVHNLEGAVIQIPEDPKQGRGAVLGVMVEDFSKQVGSPKPGETLTIKTTGPENHENTSVRGADLEIEFQIERVERIEPAPMDQVLGRLGMADEEQLRENVMLQLNRRAVIEQESAMRSQIATYLMENVELELPERVAANQVERNLQRQRMEMMYQGMDASGIEEKIAEIRSSSEESAKRELKLFFALARVADEYDVQVSQDEVLGRISELAAERNMSPQALADQLVKSRQIQSVGQQIREHKAMDEILSRAKIEEVDADEFAKRMESAGS
ncbi:MAG: trigger factor [Planctomycetota bacterium]